MSLDKVIRLADGRYFADLYYPGSFCFSPNVGEATLFCDNEFAAELVAKHNRSKERECVAAGRAELVAAPPELVARGDPPRPEWCLEAPQLSADCNVARFLREGARQ